MKPLTIHEPCNFASNWAYYHLAGAAGQMEWMQPDTKKALAQATSGLAFSSAFFHGSHTQLGQLLDNHMIKIISYILLQAHMNASNITISILTDLQEEPREMTGIQMAQHMTDMFRTEPASKWDAIVNIMDVPSYEYTFSAFTVTILTQMGYERKKVTDGLMNMMKVPKEQQKILNEQFRPELTEAVSNMNQTIDIFNAMTAAMRSISALPFNEHYSDSSVIKIMQTSLETFGEWVQEETKDNKLANFNIAADHFSTLPMISPLNKGGKGVCRQVLLGKKIDVFPGIEHCQSDSGTKHSKWHAQSARAILDLFKFVDEYVGKQIDLTQEIQVSGIGGSLFDDTKIIFSDTISYDLGSKENLI